MRVGHFLCIDVGNSRTKIAIFKKERPIYKDTLDTLDLVALQGLFDRFPISHSILCQVKNVKKPIKDYLRKHSVYKEMGLHLKLPVTIMYRPPESLGKDRLAAVCGAVRLYPDQDMLIIGSGTCITYDFVNAKSCYLGGSISPGLDMRLKAMHAFTARLPLVESRLDVGLTAKDTVASLQSGAVWGIQSELAGIIGLYLSKYPDIQVILCGGGAKFYKNRLKKTIFALPNLVTLGLNGILILNVQNT
ncbi:MAG: type III pantothenate kinase [Saprospiraceae bacterium]